MTTLSVNLALFTLIDVILFLFVTAICHRTVQLWWHTWKVVWWEKLYEVVVRKKSRTKILHFCWFDELLQLLKWDVGLSAVFSIHEPRCFCFCFRINFPVSRARKFWDDCRVEDVYVWTGLIVFIHEELFYSISAAVSTSRWPARTWILLVSR